MADVVSGSWLHWLQVVVIPLVTGLVPLIVAFFLPRWQSNLQRLQSVSDSRVKRLDAIEKALSVAAKAKGELGIDVSIHDVHSELQKIVHEFSPQEVLSREALAEWISTPSRQGRLHTPFTVPVEDARTFRGITNMTIASVVCGFIYFFGIIIFVYRYSRELLNIIEYIAHAFSVSEKVAAPILLLGLPIYFAIFPYVGALWRRRVAKRALGKLEIIAARPQETPPCFEALAPPTNTRGATLDG